MVISVGAAQAVSRRSKVFPQTMSIKLYLYSGSTLKKNFQSSQYSKWQMALL